MENKRPTLIVIAGPNGSGKTTITEQLLRHEWGEDCHYINAARIAARFISGGHTVPIDKIVSRYFKSISNCAAIIPVANRIYLYDNTRENAPASPLSRISEGQLAKQYTTEIPRWAATIFRLSHR